MKITNVHNLPDPIVSAIVNDQYKKVGDISITTLIDAPQINYLRKKHNAEIVEDASDNLFRLLGSAVHSILERSDTTNYLSEERLIAKMEGWTVSGQADLLDALAILSDYKVTSVFSFLLGDKPEWTLQLNCYAWLYRKQGFEVKEAYIMAILRDWMKSKTLSDPKYPKCAFIKKKIPLMLNNEIEAIIYDRVVLHQKAIIHGIVPPCSEEERWHKKDTWAVKKKGNKKATRVFDCDFKAVEFGIKNFKDKGVDYEIEERPGKDTKCEGYCNVAPFCDQYQDTLKNKRRLIKPNGN